MANFLFVYRGGTDAYAKMTPAEAQQSMEKWGAWIGQALQQGWMTDPGDALEQRRRDHFAAMKSRKASATSRLASSVPIVMRSACGRP